MCKIIFSTFKPVIFVDKNDISIPIQELFYICYYCDKVSFSTTLKKINTIHHNQEPQEINDENVELL